MNGMETQFLGKYKIGMDWSLSKYFTIEIQRFRDTDRGPKGNALGYFSLSLVSLLIISIFELGH